jgi:bifunctional DNA-binding transcriptional regulator/antitoxin component of YhaV-PrlF toxin-antitoxin module
MSDATTADDDTDGPLAEYAGRKIRAYNGRVSIPSGEFNPGSVLDVIIDGPQDTVAIMDAEVICHGNEEVLNIPAKKFKHYDIEEGQTVTIIVDGVTYRA